MLFRSIGADNSGKLVALVKKEAKNIAQQRKIPWVLVDGSPGIGCPVISSLSGAHFVVLVTEPTESGFHDLRRVVELVNKFKIRAGCIINKSDLNHDIREQITHYLHKQKISLIDTFPYDEIYTKTMTNGQTLAESENRFWSEKLQSAWNRIKELANQ